MASLRLRVTTVAALLLLAGCSFETGSLWPKLGFGEGEEAAVASEENGGTDEGSVLGNQSPPALGTTNFEPVPISEGQPTGTYVGEKVSGMRSELFGLETSIRDNNNELQSIRVQTSNNSQRYHGTVAAISARLQLGTTPGNPVLINQWNEAQLELDRIGADINAMNGLANRVASNAAMSAFLLETLKATYGLSGAIDEDHRQLAVLEDETNKTVVIIDRLLNELQEDVARQTAYVGNERSNLTTLSMAIKNGELYGTSLANRAYSSAAPIGSAAPGGSVAAAGRRPLVVIRFDRADVPYEQALYTAISQALDRRPASVFDVIAVAPSSGTAVDVQLAQSRSRQYAQSVLRSLTDMGLPADRVTMSATTSGDVGTNEVHVYVR